MNMDKKHSLEIREVENGWVVRIECCDLFKDTYKEEIYSDWSKLMRRLVAFFKPREETEEK